MTYYVKSKELDGWICGAQYEAPTGRRSKRLDKLFRSVTAVQPYLDSVYETKYITWVCDTRKEAERIWSKLKRVDLPEGALSYGVWHVTDFFNVPVKGRKGNGAPGQGC